MIRIFQKFTFGPLKLWLEGRLPENLRQMWEEQHGWGSDPILSSLLSHISVAIMIGGLIMFLGLSIAADVGGKEVVNRFRNVAMGALVVFGMGFFLSVATLSTSYRFNSFLASAEKHLRPSFQETGALDREGLRRRAETSLKEAGARLREAELGRPSFDPETEKLQADFKRLYAVFLAFGVIKDVGYGPFIPTTLPKK